MGQTMGQTMKLEKDGNSKAASEEEEEEKEGENGCKCQGL